MDRVPEPELMLEDDQARAYASADFEEPHGRFIELLQKRLVALRPEGVALDLGCGPGDISMRFARAFPGWKVDAVDGSPAMLDLGRQTAAAAGLESRIRFHQVLIPSGEPPHRRYELVFSNALLHHLGEPAALWWSARSWGGAGAFLFVMDLIRPESPERGRELVDQYAADEPEVLRRDFYNSLLASYSPSEVREQLREASLGHLDLEVVSDRHFIAWGPLEAPGAVRPGG
jgi:cyclopropane fatty-acyl-phospholipid synthase-like methyltransferase